MDLKSSNNLLKTSEFNLGFAAKLAVSKLLTDGSISPIQVQDFQKDCMLFVNTILTKIQNSVDLKSVILTCSSCFNPQLMLKSPKKCTARAERMIRHVIELNIMTSKEGDKAREDYGLLLKDSAKLLSFNIKKDRLDDFFFNKMHVGKLFPQLGKLMIQIFLLSHGQAAVERGFSHNKTVLQNNVSCKSVTSKRLVKDYLISSDIHPHQVKVTTAMKKYVSDAGAKYAIYLDDIKKSTKAKEDSIARNNIKNDIAEMVTRKAGMIKEVKYLKDQAKQSFIKAESSGDLCFVAAGNALNLRADEKKKDITGLIDMISTAQKKIEKSA